MELATPGSAVRHITDCVKRPGKETFECNYFEFLPVVQEAMFFKGFPFSALVSIWLSPSYTVTILATMELRLTPIYQVVMHRHES